MAYIGLGSNLGDRVQTIHKAIEKLSQISAIRVLARSALVETKPVGPIKGQPDFINAVISIETMFSPFELLDQLLLIEESLGRVRGERWGARTIDLDVLLYGNSTIAHPRLTVPHPEIRNRPFVIAGLSEVGLKDPLSHLGRGRQKSG